MIRHRKRLTALSLSAMLMLNMASVTLSVSAQAGESKTYVHDGYTVEYTIMNEWAGNQNIQVKITNTSDEVLSGWAVGYDAIGEINGLWNAQIYGQQGTEYIISSESYNCELEPGQSTNFGYILTGDNFGIPYNIYNCAERIDITDDYNVYFDIVGDYGDTYQAEIIIENPSNTDITAWQLSFDGNATIDNLWNGKILENENGSFKVKNAEHNVVIKAGNSVSFNFSGTKLVNESDVVETIVSVIEPVSETTTVTDVLEEAVTDVSRNDAFVDEFETGDTFDKEILNETDFVAETTTVFEQEIETNAEVVFDNFKLTGIVIPMEFDFEIDPEMDSDEDGLPDYIEKELGSDRYNADTDDDNLPDGYEYFILGTDLTKKDSDNNTISDADEDFDEDNLSNFDEYNLGTDPFSKDSDYDNLNDYDEINIYNTDPSKYDSDADKVSDGDEIKLGLDPNNPATNGYPDNEYTTEQTVGEDSEALDYINNIGDNPYTVSVEITAAGVAENNLSAGESGYSYSILQNDAVLGVVPELSYNDGLSVTDVIINFDVDTTQTDTSIENLMVFKYFEDNNILLPIETTYNKDTNTVSTHVDEVGTYCLIDVEKWLDTLEKTPAGNYYKDEENEPANIVFCIDTRSIIDEESFKNVKEEIKTIIEDALLKYSDIKVYVYYQQFGSDFRPTNHLLKDSKGNNYFTNYEEAVSALDKLDTYVIKNNYWAYDFVEATQFMIDSCDEKIIAMYHITADDRVVGSIGKAKKLTQTVANDRYTTVNDEEIQRIYVSTLCLNDTEPFDTSSYAYELAKLSGGIAVTGYDVETEEFFINGIEGVTSKNNNNNIEQIETNSDNELTKTSPFVYSIKRNMIGILGEGNEGTYKIISSTGLTTIKLNQKLTKDSQEDFDGDGSSDWDEVNTTMINHFYQIKKYGPLEEIKLYHLPTYEQISKQYSDLFYVKDGLTKWCQANDDSGNPYATLNQIRILPIRSDPTNPDSDGDYMLDDIDNNFVQNLIYWDIKDEKPLYAYADTKENYGLNSAGIWVEKTSKSPDEYIVKKTVPLTYYLSQTKSTPSYGGNINELTGASKIYLPFPYELQEYMQSCCDTVIREVKTNSKYADIEGWRIDMLEKYLTPELLMAIGTTESGWTYGGIYGIGISETYTGIINSGASVMPNTVAGVNASTDKNDYINIYCSISGTTCLLAYIFLYVGDSRVGFEKKDYDITEKSFEQKFIYDVIYAYGSGCELDYYRSETRISSAYKIYAFNEFLKVNGSEWTDWTKELIGGYCDNVTTFTWIYNNPQEYSNVVLPQNSKVE